MTPPGDDSASAPPAPAASSPKKSKGKAKVKPEEIPAFDYSQEPNGLDSFKAAPPTKLARKPKKPKGRECLPTGVTLLTLQPSSILPTSESPQRILQDQRLEAGPQCLKSSGALHMHGRISATLHILTC